MQSFTKIVLCLLGVALATPSIADEPLSEKYAVAPTNIAVNSAYVEQRVREVFADAPIMIAIARCESGFRQFEADGSLNVSNQYPASTASGVFQILYTMHKPDWSARPDTDITTLEGNLRYARIMYEESGTSPWEQCL